MKIISQIDESTFVVRMEEHDLDSQQDIFVAHNYFSVSQKVSISPAPTANLYGKFVFAGNVWMKQHCHISIRPMIELVMPFLLKHPYMQKEHLFNKDGSEAYNYSPVNICLHGHEKFVQKQGEASYEEREVLEYKSVMSDESFRFEPYYDVKRKVLRCGIKDVAYQTCKEEKFAQNHISLNEE